MPGRENPGGWRVLLCSLSLPRISQFLELLLNEGIAKAGGRDGKQGSRAEKLRSGERDTRIMAESGRDEGRERADPVDRHRPH